MSPQPPQRVIVIDQPNAVCHLHGTQYRLAPAAGDPQPSYLLIYDEDEEVAAFAPGTWDGVWYATAEKPRSDSEQPPGSAYPRGLPV
jgi:hypothetical protein